MNSASEFISYTSLVLFPAYLIYLVCYSSSLEDRYARAVVRNRQKFMKNKSRLKGWRVSLAYETYKDDLALSPEMHYCVEVNVGRMFFSSWRSIMIAPAQNSREMLEKFKKSDLVRLPKAMQASDYVHVAGQDSAWKLGLVFITAIPFAFEVARALLLS